MKLLALVLAACGGSSAATPPSNTHPATTDQPPELDGLTEEQRCTAVEPRTLPCIDEVFNAQSVAMIGVDWSKERRSDAAEAKKLHELNCLAGPSYTAAIASCWNERTCDAFASCVVKRDSSNRSLQDAEPLRLDP